MIVMATTIDPQDGKFSNGSSNSTSSEPDEDIAAIAKQISDHAEAIYQTWKARGLAPNEILTCHSAVNATNKFDSVLTPHRQTSAAAATSSSNGRSPSPVVQLLCTSPSSFNRNHLENFVNKFVVEDKARLASKKNYPKNFPSSIQHAVQKFEKNSPPNDSRSPVKSPSFQKSPELKSSPTKINTQIFSSNRTFPEKIIPTSNAPTMQKPGTVDSAGTWPIKKWEESENLIRKYQTLPTKNEMSRDSGELLEEVAKEEEQRLIHALKSGVILSAENKLSMAEKTKPLENGLDKKPGLSNDAVSRRSFLRNSRSPSGDPEMPTSQPKLSLKQAFSSSTGSGNPVRPFLTRGSVAERVLIFEKCPTEIIEKRTKSSTSTTAPWKNVPGDVHSKIQTYSKDINQKTAPYPPHTTLRRHTKANKNVFIPRFHYPYGKPSSQQQQNSTLNAIKDVFQSFPNSRATKEQFSSVTKACEFPLYWKAPLFIACGGEKVGYVDMNNFIEYWRELTSVCHDEPSRFMRIVTHNATRSYILPEDLIPLVQDVVNTHPGLTFLKQAPEFHSRYVHTVICRVYYCVNQSWNGQITLAELRRSDFLRAVRLLEEEEDINQVTAYFSYEHFYVIYCKFWELDRDHDLYISKEDLARHCDHALSTRIIDRIFAITRRNKSPSALQQDGKMSYTDFVIFLLAEEDKHHPRAIEYWFRCMDLDGDGYLSMYELEYFYDEQLQRMEAMGIECLPFEDCLCQMLDMIQPKIPGKISLSDLKRCKMTPIFFDTFFNLEKYLDHEQRDPFASQRDHDNDISDWDRYAAEEYELLVAEEGGNANNDELECDEYGVTELGNDEEEDDMFSCNLDEILNNGPRRSISFVNNGLYHNNVINGSSSSNKSYSGESGYITEDYFQPSTIITDYSNRRSNNSDSSDDYAGDSDDCSL